MKINKPLSAALAAAGLGYAIGNLNPAYVMGLRKGYDLSLIHISEPTRPY